MSATRGLTDKHGRDRCGAERTERVHNHRPIGTDRRRDEGMRSGASVGELFQSEFNWQFLVDGCHAGVAHARPAHNSSISRFTVIHCGEDGSARHWLAISIAVLAQARASNLAGNSSRVSSSWSCATSASLQAVSQRSEEMMGPGL
jgi:hypothetical protein